MFDWDDEELTNIIWGEAGESDDHIVPYPDKIDEKPQLLFGDDPEKESNRETSDISFLEQKKATIKSEAGVELDSSPRYKTRDHEKEFGLNSWSDASLSNAAKVDGNSVSGNASNDLTKSTKHGTLTDETAQFDKDSKLLQNLTEGREDGDFVNYDWANIGSFADLDNIFSNNDPIFGDTSIGNTDELWLSTKDVAPLSDSSDLPLKIPDGSNTKAQYMIDPGPSHTLQDVQGLEISGKIRACFEQPVDVSAATVNELPVKLSSSVQGNRQKRLSNIQTTYKKQPHDACGACSSSTIPFPQVNSTYPFSTVNPLPSLVLPQQQFPTPQLLQQKHFSGQLLASPLYGDIANNYPGTSALAGPSGYDVPPVNATIKPPAMSPREKIEKLRRRQKMRARLAIQRQQKQFGKQVEHPNMKGGRIEVDPNSPIEQNDSNTVSMAIDNCSVEESVLHRLQGTIANLDTRTRLCIRDSLFRLARSAMRRQYPSDISSASTSSKDVLINKDIENHERFTRMPDIETDTNPIDRTVAHLLFHRPLEFSGKSAETPELPTSSNFPCERKETPSIKLQDGPQSFENTQMTSQHESNTHGLFSGDTSENASINDNVDGGSKMVEYSK